jgi:hypothetical protein
VDHAAGVLFEGQRLKPEEFLVFWKVNVDQAILAAIGLKDVGVRLFTDLTLELLPRIGDQVIAFLLLLHFLL